jgi:hypothetical protein
MYITIRRLFDKETEVSHIPVQVKKRSFTFQLYSTASLDVVGVRCCERLRLKKIDLKDIRS